MTDKKKKPGEDEVSDEQLEGVAGGYVLPVNTRTVVDSIAAQSSTVLGATDALSAANSLLSQLPTPQVDGEVPTKGS